MLMKSEGDAELDAKFNLGEQSRPAGEEPPHGLALERLRHLRQVKIERYVANTPKHRMSALRLPSALRSPSDFARAENPQLFADVDEQTLNALDRFALKQEHFARRRALLDRRLGQTGSKVLRGKLGVDTFFLGFGLLGVLLIPLYFGYTFAQRRERLRALRLPDEPAAPDDDELERNSRDLAFFDAEPLKRAVAERERLRRQTRSLRGEPADAAA